MSKFKKAKIENEPWNKDKAVGQMAPFTIEQAALIRSLLTAEAKVRDLALFNTALDTMLRASDLLPLRVIDIPITMAMSFMNSRSGRKKPGAVMSSRFSLTRRIL